MKRRLRVVRASELIAEPSKKIPKCETCGGDAAIVCANPKLGMYEDVDPIGRFFCDGDCGVELTNWWYWFYLVKTREEADGFSLGDSLDSVLHVWEKTWGPEFLTWLFSEHDIRSLYWKERQGDRGSKRSPR